MELQCGERISLRLLICSVNPNNRHPNNIKVAVAWLHLSPLINVYPLLNSGQNLDWEGFMSYYLGWHPVESSLMKYTPLKAQSLAFPSV